MMFPSRQEKETGNRARGARQYAAHGPGLFGDQSETREVSIHVILGEGHADQGAEMGILE